MSRYFGLGWPSTKDGRESAEKIRKNTQIQKAGSKWRGGDRRWGRSLMDQAEYSRMASDYAGKYSVDPGQPGVYNLKVMKDGGVEHLANAVINIGGKMFKSNGTGDLRVLDSEYLNSEIAAFNELRDYETKIVKAIVVSDETAALILGTYKNKTGLDMLANGGLAAAGIQAGDIDVDARPSSIRYLDPTSTHYARAIAKIRVLVHTIGIIINEEGGNLSAASTGIKQSADTGNDAARAVTA